MARQHKCTCLTSNRSLYFRPFPLPPPIDFHRHLLLSRRDCAHALAHREEEHGWRLGPLPNPAVCPHTFVDELPSRGLAWTPWLPQPHSLYESRILSNSSSLMADQTLHADSSLIFHTLHIQALSRDDPNEAAVYPHKLTARPTHPPKVWGREIALKR